MTIVTRFAPSPTGFLHIGGARTALFNWLFARHHGGRFLLRIEDTDRARSTDANVEAIYEGLSWLEIDWDGDAVSQYSRAERHREIVAELLERGQAYRCYTSRQELEVLRAEARAEGRAIRNEWRDREPADAPSGLDPVIRIKAPREGQTVLHDLVQGDVVTPNYQLDDMVLLRSDGSPTYMLAVVVDDHDMAVSHIIRGDDHLTNGGRQLMIYHALDWEPPAFAHIPLIHGSDGAKLSKRHGALGVEAYRDLGFLPEALSNYLLRLGWSHGDAEIISRAQAIEWFDLDQVGKSAARFDVTKLENLNSHYIREADGERLLGLIAAGLRDLHQRAPNRTEIERLTAALPVLRSRAKTLPELVQAAEFCVATRPLELDPKAQKVLGGEARQLLARLGPRLQAAPAWSAETLEQALGEFAASNDLKLGKIAQPLRAALTGRAASPGIYDVLVILGRDESLNRIFDQTGL